MEPSRDIQQTLISTSSVEEPSKNEATEENERFTKHSALVTLLIMSIGPLSLLVQALGEMVDMLMITRRYNDDQNSHAIEIIGFTGQLIAFSLYVGLFFGQAISSRVSSLIGAGDRASASHLVSDCIYLCFIVSCFFVVIFMFIMKPFLRFLGTPDYMLSETFRFLIPIYFVIPITSIVYLEQYFLQSIGSSIKSGLVKVSVYVLQLLVFSPLFLFLFKVPTTFMKLGNIVANIIVAFSMMFMMYRGKFSLKLNFKDICDKFNPEIKKALLSASPLLLMYLVYSLPQILILQTLTSTAPQYAQQIGGVFAVYTKLVAITQEIPGALTQSFLSCGTHAWGSNNPKRLIRLVGWTMFISTSLTLVVSLIIIIKKEPICSAFLDGPLNIKLATHMIPIPFYTTPLCGISITISFLMIVIGKPIFSFIPQAIQMLILCIGCKVLAKLNQDDVTKVMYVYNIADIFVLVLNLILLFVPIRDIRRKIKEKEYSKIESPFLSTPLV